MFRHFFATLIAALIVLAAPVVTTAPAEAGQCKLTQGQDCGRVHTPAKGKAPRFEVINCLDHDAYLDGRRESVACSSPEAVSGQHKGRPVVCFVASDGHVYHDLRSVVWIGHRFFNRIHGGAYSEPDWE